MSTSRIVYSSPGAAGLFVRNWWVLFMRGLLAAGLGFLVFTLPVMTLTVVVMGFGLYALFEGASSLVAAIRGWNHREHRWLLVLEAIFGIGVGIITLRTPAITAKMLIVFIAVWALATGILRIIEGIRLRRESSIAPWLIFGGLASIVLSIVIVLRPIAGLFAMVQVIGIYALFLGMSEIVLAFQLRGLRRLEGAAVSDRLRGNRLDTEIVDPNLDLRERERHR
jgi:uncharacterized membrane protein HdeD (DUF308 family)